MFKALTSALPLCLLAVLCVSPLSASAGNCIPTPHILSPNAGGRLVADAVVIGKAASPVEGYYDSAVMRVSAVYAGAAPRRIVVESGRPAVNSIECPLRLDNVPIGTRLLMNVQQDPITGRLGGGFYDSVLRVDGNEISGRLVYPDCPPDDSNCLYAEQTMDLSEFQALAETYHPGQFSAKPTVSVGTLDIGLRDGEPSIGSEIALDFETSPLCTGLKPNAVRIGEDGGVLEISLRLVSPQAEVTPAPPCDIGWPEVIPVGRVYEAGSHVVKLYAERGDGSEGFFRQDKLVGELPFEVVEASALANPETPAAGSIQSGIGLIRGWACDATSVHVQFDNLPPIELAYGTSRTDTLSVCGDENNGYGTVFAWGSLGEGMHTMSTWIDGVRVATVEFEVRGLGSPFVTGLTGEYELENFLETGQGVTVSWSQAAQNFIITGLSD